MAKLTDKLKALRAKYDALPPAAKRAILVIVVLALGFVLGRCTAG